MALGGNALLERGEGHGGLPDMPPLDHGVRPFASLEQRVSAEGHYDAHRTARQRLPATAPAVMTAGPSWPP